MQRDIPLGRGSKPAIQRSDVAAGLPVFVGAIAVAMLILVTGCGGPDFSSNMRGGTLDSGLAGSYGGYGGRMDPTAGRQTSDVPRGGVYPMVEIKLELSDVPGNPFNYIDSDVRVTIMAPDQHNTQALAFYDGGKVWKVRYTPRTQGRHTVAGVTVNGRSANADSIEPREFTVSGKSLPGFIRLDPRDRTRFIHEDGTSFYPIGMNVAWGDVVPIIGKLGATGANWARVWMCHWGGANLDWVMDRKLEEGTLDLNVAKRWDEIITAAEKAGVYVQVVLQHHGQYSTRTNPNWSENPWNKANGGFLATPGEFFVNPRALALTQAKYRYILARWGYSPNIMAWELFNEVEWTDAIANKHANEVAAWHNSMAQFLRKHDPYGHLITTSSDLNIPGLWQSMDYRQPHAYPSDSLAVTGAFDATKQDKPIFYGEIGPSGLKDDGTFLHRSLWSSMMSATAGAAQYWAWDAVDRSDWYAKFKPAVQFIRESGLASRRGLLPASVTVVTNESGPLTLRPGAGWSSAKVTDISVPSSISAKTLAEWAAVPSFLQGKAHREMFSSLTLRVTFAQPGSCSVAVSRVARAGAHVVLSVDGQIAAEKTYPPGAQDRDMSDSIAAKVGSGAHVIKIENTGEDWAVISHITLDPYAPALGAIGKANAEYGALWLYNRTSSAVGGRIALAGIKPGDYDVTWFDTQSGTTIKRERVTVRPRESLSTLSPAVKTDVAAWFTRASGGGKAVRTPGQGNRTPQAASSPTASQATVEPRRKQP
jgi:hypothetical protein